jgi:uncharacterized protein with von Willebrand factor type A (vWA) domain
MGPDSRAAATGRLAENIVHFARALRAAGLPIGTDRALTAVQAVAAAGFTDRTDFRTALRACLISRPEHRVVFDQAFRLYWRDPRFLDQMMGLIAPMVRGVQEERRAGAGERRAAEGLLAGADRAVPRDMPDEGTVIEIDARGTASAAERLKRLDFELMSAAEMAEARRIISRLALPVRPLSSRRKVARAGRLPDWRGTLRDAARRAGEVRKIETRSPGERWPNLVVLCDISGSMSPYSRAVLQFLHAVANRKGQGWVRVHAFTFGTRLTNITRHLTQRDVDAALAAAGAEAQDWAGGTRIGSCIAAFNRDWSRRVMGQGAVVILITDGLDRDPAGVLGPAMERLGLSARAVIWLNPLLRWDGFAPRAQGIAAMLPHVTSLRAGHNIAALEGLAAAVADPGDGGEKARMMALLR